MVLGSRRYRVTLDDGNFFYLAGIWEPALAGWPLAFKIIHGAIILRRQVVDWLDTTIPAEDLLVTPPPNLFSIEQL